MANWFVTSKKADFQKIAERYGIDPVLARIIRNRDVIEETQMEHFLYGTLEDVYSPWLLKDMKKAVSILKEKIHRKCRIRIIGDYDIDGVCSTHILQTGLSACGANVEAMVPHRIYDGYGLNELLILDAYQAKVDTIVTCDNGIAAKAEIEYANELGMTVIVTDHHEVPENVPDAAAIINPKQKDCNYPFQGICGAVVAYKLIQALAESFSVEEKILSELLEFAAFATIGDVMELKDENRILVKYGLFKMQQSNNMGLRALIEVNGIDDKKLSPYHIGFVMGPCVNATGRLDTAERALRLLQTQDREEAVQIASELKGLNDSRKELTAQGVLRAIEMIENTPVITHKILIVYLPDCHESLAGIIAGRIRERYHKPTFILTKGEESVKGSGRSIESYHMFEEMNKCKDLFIKFGGHKMAAGLSLEEAGIPEFQRRMNENTILTEEDFVEKVCIDVPMPFSYVTKDFIKSLELLEPFGVGNPKPLFAEKGIHFLTGRILGKNQNVGKFTVCDKNGTRYPLIYFGDLDKFKEEIIRKYGEMEYTNLFDKGSKKIELAVAYYPDLNHYQGVESIQYVMQYYQ